MIENNILGVILAGGKSARFGKDKTKVKLGNKTLLEHTISKIEKYFKEILIVSNSELKNSNKKVEAIPDCIKGNLGPLVGVLSAMKWIKSKNKNYQWLATFPSDTPFFKEKIIKEIIKSTNKFDEKLFFIKNKNKRHNIFGLWSLDLVNDLEKDIHNDYRKVETWANKMGSKIIDINDDDLESFLNINTMEDYDKAKKKYKL